MYERILLPLDGSRLSEAALAHAEAIAKQFGSTLVLLRVVSPPVQAASDVPPETFSVSFEQDRAQAEQYLAAVEERLTGQQMRVETRIVVGQAPEEILSAAREASLVVMATHGRGGLGRAIFGSVASEVLQHCHLPLLLVHPE